MRTLQVRRGRGSAKAKKRKQPARAGVLRASLAESLESLVASAADRAAEDAIARWRQHPAGAALLSELAEAAKAGRSAASDYLATALADLGMAENAATESGPPPVEAAALARSSAVLADGARQAVADWQERVLKLVQAENITKRSIARVVSFDHDSLGLVLMVGVLGTAPRGDVVAGIAGSTTEAGASASGPERLLSSLFGAAQLREITTTARRDLHDRVNALFGTEMERFASVIDSAGVPDEACATALVTASEALEAVR